MAVRPSLCDESQKRGLLKVESEPPTQRTCLARLSSNLWSVGTGHVNLQTVTEAAVFKRCANIWAQQTPGLTLASLTLAYPHLQEVLPQLTDTPSVFPRSRNCSPFPPHRHVLPSPPNRYALSTGLPEQLFFDSRMNACCTWPLAVD